MRTYVVGDVHGQAEKLRGLMGQVHAEAAPGDALVFLGDYIDRGPDSRGAVETVRRLVAGDWEGPVTALKGNHEVLLLDFISPRPQFAPEVWMQNGGYETVISYTGGSFTRKWHQSVPPSHLQFLADLELWHQDENGIYVHAGLEPGKSPEECSEDTFLWIREPFIESDYAWEKVVVFGHTPQYSEPAEPVRDRARLPWRPLVRPEKIGIDTGAAYGGPLTAVVLPERRFLTAP